MFDFGFAKELPKDDEGTNFENTYLFTGSTGTPRYMAPGELAMAICVCCHPHAWIVLKENQCYRGRSSRTIQSSVRHLFLWTFVMGNSSIEEALFGIEVARRL